MRVPHLPRFRRRGVPCHLWNMQTVYEATGGADGLLRLASAWHARVMADEVVSHAFSHGFHPEHSQRLAAYWAEALGGPTTYSGSYGDCDETSVVRMHSGNGPHKEMDRRAISCFDQALADVGLASDDRLRQVLHDYFAWAPPPRCPAITDPQMTCQPDCASRTGRGTDSSMKRVLTTSDRTTSRPRARTVSRVPNESRRTGCALVGSAKSHERIVCRTADRLGRRRLTGCEPDVGHDGDRGAALPIWSTRAGTRAAPTAARWRAPRLRTVLARQATGSHGLGHAVASLARLLATRRPGRRARCAARGMAPGRGRTGGSRLRRRARQDGHCPRLSGRAGWRTRR